MERLTRDGIATALRALANEIENPGTPIELIVVGGAALVLLYDARDTTKDVDAFATDATATARLRAAAQRVAALLGLPDDWLNDAARGYAQGVSRGPVLLETPSLVVRTLAPAQLLAMKLCAWRDDLDVSDARLLLSKIPGDRDLVWLAVAPHLLPGRELKASYAFADLWEADRGA